jgi:hypothetical protein
MESVNSRPWVNAVEAQLEALRLVQMMNRIRSPKTQELGWQLDEPILTAAKPYAWSREVTTMVLDASRSIPLDTEAGQVELGHRNSILAF